ncbi:gamma-glutamylcyclotransferase family protein [Clostridium sp. CF012]|uniref:gamma-glutamylcyclotransferase family protein n=1 Tax=Clostridium sp. CF012 TaxID=2843319 RepID=UPI001C0D60ED|nr:gamma-glutamylcyclotransferase family protein [Clostridium sp. CF012]MBU3145647.1 gamma-glutamylcyclotransferase [Clostridium sp. CF012]
MNLVFAYGSLTNRMEIEKTLKEDDAQKDYVVLGIGKLDNYRLAFTKKSKNWKGGVLDVVTSRNHDYVLGLVVEVSDRALRAIDRREGVSVGAYVRKTVNVYLAGEMVEVIVYTVVNKEISGVKASTEYVSKVEAGMRQEGFPEEYINKYLIGEVTEECKHKALLYLRGEEHAQGLFELAHMAWIDLWDIPLLVDSLTKDGYIRQHKEDVVGKYDVGARYFTVKQKRKEIDDMLLEGLKKSFIPYESIDCINADLNHKTMACMKCLTTHKDGETFCRKCLSALSEIDTPILDIMFDLNKKGYKTEFCCCGHPTLNSFYSAYFVVNRNISGITTPDGFTLKCADHKTSITSIYVKKKLKLSTVDLEELAKKNLGNLRKWVIELPDQLGN